MGNAPLLYDEMMSSMAKPVGHLDIEEVRNAAEHGLFLPVSVAVMENWKQRVIPMDLFNVSNVIETPNGFSFIASCLQHVTTLLHDYSTEKSYELTERKSVCKVEVEQGKIELSFVTSVTVDYVSFVKSPDPASD